MPFTRSFLNVFFDLLTNQNPQHYVSKLDSRRLLRLLNSTADDATLRNIILDCRTAPLWERLLPPMRWYRHAYGSQHDVVLSSKESRYLHLALLQRLPKGSKTMSSKAGKADGYRSYLQLDYYVEAPFDYLVVKLVVVAFVLLLLFYFNPYDAGVLAWWWWKTRGLAVDQVAQLLLSALLSDLQAHEGVLRQVEPGNTLSLRDFYLVVGTQVYVQPLRIVFPAARTPSSTSSSSSPAAASSGWWAALPSPLTHLFQPQPTAEVKPEVAPAGAVVTLLPMHHTARREFYHAVLAGHFPTHGAVLLEYQGWRLTLGVYALLARWGLGGSYGVVSGEVMRLPLSLQERYAGELENALGLPRGLALSSFGLLHQQVLTSVVLSLVRYYLKKQRGAYVLKSQFEQQQQQATITPTSSSTTNPRDEKTAITPTSPAIVDLVFVDEPYPTMLPASLVTHSLHVARRVLTQRSQRVVHYLREEAASPTATTVLVPWGLSHIPFIASYLLGQGGGQRGERLPPVLVVDTTEMATALMERLGRIRRS